MSPFFDASVGLAEGYSVPQEGLTYSDCEECYKAPVPEQLLLADFVPQFGP